MRLNHLIAVGIAALCFSAWAIPDPVESYALLSTSQTLLRDRAKVNNNAKVASLGYVELGSQAEVAYNVESNANVFLRSNSLVRGDVVTTGTISKQAGARILGYELPRTAVTIPAVPTVGPFTPGSANIEVRNGQSFTLPPGAYANVVVRSRAKLYLTSGTYTIKTLQIESDVIVYFNLAAGTPAQVNVSQEMSIGSRVSFDLQGATNLELVKISSMQTNTLRIDTDSHVKGIFTLSFGSISVADRTIVDGALRAKNIEISAGSVVNGIPQ
jgi:hypothetical protein